MVISNKKNYTSEMSNEYMNIWSFYSHFIPAYQSTLEVYLLLLFTLHYLIYYKIYLLNLLIN